ncbi:MAG: galactose mutarotase [Proteobacteria bacterium]|nr:galactose mutarotase [Pseudomonadota bacterium]
MKSVNISCGRSRATILDFGATVESLFVPAGGTSRNIVLTLAERGDYQRHGAFFGAIAGRCANRTRDGQATINGTLHQLALNERGVTHLHGGMKGFSNRSWKIDAADERQAALSYLSADGEEGYPGNLKVTCVYRFESESCLSITLTAETDATTIVNLATHSYFNLGTGPDILGHRLRIPSARITPVDERLIPTGELRDVAGSGFDFRKGQIIGENRRQTPSGFDVNYAVYDSPLAELRPLAAISPAEDDVTLEIWSTEPGLQFYDGQYLPLETRVADGRHARFGGCCLEPQRFPDAVNHAHFPSVTLEPGQIYRQKTEYRFT